MSDVSLLRTIFKSRTDVFAIRWQKGTKSGYTPAYQFDPYLLRQHKMGGGTMQDFAAKTYLPLTDEQLKKHVDGQQFIGIYPLLSDNTSWWIAADFDENDWVESAGRFIDACRKFHIPAYLERSRSGNGGHVWIFFSQPYPAVRSRKIFIWLLESSGAFSVFDKSASFDRLFPNQDYLSGKGLGNLIALPLHGPSVQAGNCCFIDPKTLIPFADQWAFLDSIQHSEVSLLDAIFEKTLSNTTTVPTEKSDLSKLTIRLDNMVHLSRNNLPLPLVNYLKDTFTFANSAFYVKEKSGRSTWNTDRFFKLIDEEKSELRVPRGGIGGILRFCSQQGISLDFRDERRKLPTVNFDFSASLLAHQEVALQAVRQKDFGVIVAPPGSGKTIIALKIIAEKQQPALVLVHRKQLLDQWVERIETFLGIPKHEIGVIGKGKMKPGKKVTVATIQSLPKAFEKPEFATSFGLIVVDECHHIPAETFRDAIAKLHTRYLYGLTATPFRKHSDGRLIFLFLGDVLSEVKPEETSLHRRAKIIIRSTSFDVPFNPKTDPFEVLSKILIHDSNRNKIILQDIEKELRSGRKVIIITERKEHIDALHLYLKPQFEVITLSGDDSENVRATKWKTLHSGNYQALITTGQFFGEGVDLKNATCLFLVYPFSFKGKLIQYIGRVQRGEISPIIYDYHDQKIDYLHRMFLKRNAYYRTINRQQTLFDEPDPNKEIQETVELVHIREKVKIPLDQFEFQYGAVSFLWTTKHLESPVLLEIENDYLRPEFVVLTPYLSKSLRFVLSPFAFVFLLKGETHYHVVLETLDTEEATYIWHVAQDKSLLKSTLDRINTDLQYIRTHGRQHFLASEPPSFTRIQHDYSDARKGFVIWRDGLEEWLS